MPRSVLIVDDSIVALAQLAGILEADARYEIVARANNGAEALKKFAEKKPGLVIMDIVMPVMDGIQALRTLRAMDQSVRVILVSSVAGDSERATDALRAGAHAVMPKPYDAAEVMATIDRVCESEA